MQAPPIKYFSTHNPYIHFVYSKESCINYPSHTHQSFYIVGLVLDGEIVLQKGASRQLLQPGSIYSISPDELHSIELLNTSYSSFCICIHKDYPSLTGRQWWSEALSHAHLLIEYNIVSDTQILDLLNAFGELTTNHFPNNEKSQEAPDFIKDMKQYLLEHPHTLNPCDQLSNDFFISKYHMIRVFKSNFGLTPHQYQMQNKVRLAKELLKDYDTIVEVALDAGFCDQSHLNKWFKKFVGINPSEYKESLAQKVM